MNQGAKQGGVTAVKWERDVEGVLEGGLRVNLKWSESPSPPGLPGKVSKSLREEANQDLKETAIIQSEKRIPLIESENHLIEFLSKCRPIQKVSESKCC